MVDIDEYASRAVESPVSEPPEMSRIREIVRFRRRRRFHGLAVGVIVVGVTLAVAVPLVNRSSGESRSQVKTPPAASKPPATSAITVPATSPAVRPSSPYDPALTVPAGVTLCRADDLGYLPGGASTGLLRFVNRRGDACGLAGHPALLGRTVDGAWVEIPTQLSFGQPVSAERWSGVFEPTKTAVISIKPSTASSPAQCNGHELTVRHFYGLRLDLPDEAGTIDIPDAVDFDLGVCPPDLSPFGYDSSDAIGR